MIRRPRSLLGIALLQCWLGVHAHAQAPAETAIYAVSYVDVLPSARGPIVAALKQYRDASRKDNGFIRFDLLEQVGRPGHLAIIETWKDQQAVDGHAMAAHVKQWQDAVQPVRLSGYDQRLYKVLTVEPA